MLPTEQCSRKGAHRTASGTASSAPYAPAAENSSAATRTCTGSLSAMIAGKCSSLKLLQSRAVKGSFLCRRDHIGAASIEAFDRPIILKVELPTNLECPDHMARIAPLKRNSGKYILAVRFIWKGTEIVSFGNIIYRKSSGRHQSICQPFILSCNIYRFLNCWKLRFQEEWAKRRLFLYTKLRLIKWQIIMVNLWGISFYSFS